VDEGENYIVAIEAVLAVIARYDPKLYGFDWAPEDNPRFQFGPMGYRGYIEARPVRAVNAT
jgi:AraC family transcriptional regulator